MSKRILPILASFALLFNQTSAQTTVTVNNTPGTAANYRTLQGAIDSVAAGTIILLQPGSGSYGTVKVKKLVSIFGPGYFLGLNPAPYTQATTGSAIVDAISFEDGSNGSMVSGLSLAGYSSPYPYARISTTNTSNITVTRCYLEREGGGTWLGSINSSNIVFKQCYCYLNGGNGLNVLANGGGGNLQFYNCIFDGTGVNLNAVGDQAVQVTYKNCIFRNIYGPVAANISVTFINNIIFAVNNTVVACTAASNNIGNVPFSTGPGNNVSNATIDNTLVLNTDGNIISNDGKMSLKSNSPAKNFGNDGKDAGASGGAEPYVLSGIPIIPNIYLAETVGAATGSGGLKIRIKAKANQ